MHTVLPICYVLWNLFLTLMFPYIHIICFSTLLISKVLLKQTVHTTHSFPHQQEFNINCYKPGNGETAHISVSSNLEVEVSLSLLKHTMATSSAPPALPLASTTSGKAEEHPTKKQKVLHGVLVMKNNVSWWFWVPPSQPLPAFVFLSLFLRFLCTDCVSSPRSLFPLCGYLCGVFFLHSFLMTDHFLNAEKLSPLPYRVILWDICKLELWLWSKIWEKKQDESLQAN